MFYSRFASIGFAALLLVAGLTVLVPRVEAVDPNTWTPLSMASLTGGVTITAIREASGGEKVGLVYLVGTNLNFLLKPSATDAWTAPFNDITGADSANTNYQLTFVSGSTWVVLATIAANEKFYYTTNDGTSWTVGATYNCGSSCATQTVRALVGNGSPFVGGNVVASLRNPDNDFAIYESWDYTTGTGPLSSQVISDNQGFGGYSGTTIDVFGSDLQAEPDGFTAWFHSGDGKNYEVGTTDGIYWSIPYTAAGGSTRAPITTTNCPGVAATTGSLSVAKGSATGTNSDTAFTVGRNGASNIYLCSFTGSTSDAYPSAAPGTAQTQSTGFDDAIASNGFDQYIATGRQGTANYVIYKSSPTATWAQVYTTGANTAIFGVEATPSRGYFVYLDGNAGNRLTVASATMTPSSIAPLAVRTFTGERIKGADMDTSHASIIVRTQSATTQRIHSLVPSTLVDKGAQDNGCNAQSGSGTEREQGVFSYHDREVGQDYVSFLDCTVSNRDNADTWRIRNGALGAPVFADGSVCANDSFCDTNIQSASETCDNHIGAGGNDLPNQAQQISDVQSIPISYTRDGTNSVNHATVGFAFNDLSTGDIGVWAQTDNHLSVNSECAAKVPFTTPGATYQICTWSNSGRSTPNDPSDDGNDYLAAVSTSANTKTLRVNVDVVRASGAITFEPNVSLTSVSGPASPWDLATAISCGADTDAVIMASNGHINRIHMIGTNLGQPVWPNDMVVSIPKQRGVAFANSGYGAAYYDSGAMKIINRTGMLNATITLPAHTFYVGADLDDTAQYLAVYLLNGADGVVAVYDVHTATTGASVPVDTRPEGCVNNENQIVPCNGDTSTTSTSTSGPGGGGVASTLFGFTTVGNTLAALATVAFFVVIAYMGTSRRRDGGNNGNNDEE